MLDTWTGCGDTLASFIGSYTNKWIYGIVPLKR